MSWSKLRSAGNRAQAWSEIGQSISVHAVRVPEQSSYQQHVSPFHQNPGRAEGGVGGDGGAGMGELGTLHRRGRTLRSYSCGEKRSYGCGASYVRSHEFAIYGVREPKLRYCKTAIQPQSGNQLTHAERGICLAFSLFLRLFGDRLSVESSLSPLAGEHSYPTEHIPIRRAEFERNVRLARRPVLATC